MELQSDTYFSIRKESQGGYREKASKFIAIAIPVGTEGEVKTTLDRIRKEYHGANHFCYAYRLGFDKRQYRINDDGEPSGSAGKPIFGQIQSFDLSDILVVVVRYFGGTKLGIPGLINAYRTAARESLTNASIIEKTLMARVEIIFDYPAMNDIMRIVKEKECRVIDQVSDERCTIRLKVKMSFLPSFRERITSLNRTSILLRVNGIPE